MFTAAIAAAVVSSAAHGAIMETNAFEADAFESFDNLDSARAGSLDIFEGFATAEAESGTLIRTTSWRFYGRGHSVPNSGTHFIGTSSGPITYRFSEPIYGFGGFFTTNADVPGGTIEFLSDLGELISSQPLDVSADADSDTGKSRWAFNTFTSSAPISSVRVTGNYNEGGFVMHDDIRISTVPIPSPGGASTLALASFALIRRARAAS